MIDWSMLVLMEAEVSAEATAEATAESSAEATAEAEAVAESTADVLAEASLCDIALNEAVEAEALMESAL